MLCLTGDAVPVGDHGEARGCFDLDSVQLLHGIRQMEEGYDFGGNELQGAVEFCAGATVTPEAEPLEPQLIKFEKKIDAGGPSSSRPRRSMIWSALPDSWSTPASFQ